LPAAANVGLASPLCPDDPSGSVPQLEQLPLHSAPILRSPESDWTEVIVINLADAQRDVPANAFTE
jgi:hypothetical protein